MIHSIRQFLLVNLLLCITITSTLTAIGNYFLDQQDIEHHLDSLLAQTTISFAALISNDEHKRDLGQIQSYIEKIPEKAVQLYNDISHSSNAAQYQDKFQFQVWSRDNRLLLRSPNAPEIPMSNGQAGFSEKYIKHRSWRVYTTIIPDTGTRVEVAERYDIRSELAHKIARDDIYILFLIYPLLGLLIWTVIGRGFSSIAKLSNEITQREANYLEPVDLKAVPKEVKPLVDELNHLLLRLKEGFEREQRFSADAAHELKTPLAALKTHAGLALQTTTDEDVKPILNNVIEGVDRASHTVSQLLTLSRIHPEFSNPDNFDKIDISEVTKRIIGMLAGSALGKNIDIAFESAIEGPVLINGNDTMLEILVRNLVDNAIRYTDSGGHVLVSFDQTPESVILTVEDDGPGIPAELRTRVFERFYRILGSKASGSGLGLPLVLQIAKLHNGQVKLGAGKDGKGLRIDIIFSLIDSSNDTDG